jgi:hypothetical protein
MERWKYVRTEEHGTLEIPENRVLRENSRAYEYM